MTTAVRRQARGERRRLDLLDATIRLIAREGTHAVTLRAVAAEAGASLRATTYYFESKEELVAEAFRHYASRAVERFDAIVAAAGWADGLGRLDAQSAAEMLAAVVADDLLVDRLGLLAEYELVLEISRDPRLAPAYRAWQRRLEALLVAGARALGSPVPERHARLILAVVRGLEIEALARPKRRVSRTELAEMFGDLVGALTSSFDRRPDGH